MDLHIEPVPFGEIAQAVRAHYTALPSAIDSFLEERILSSAHYRIESGRDAAGFASVHDGTLITQFVLYEQFRHLGQQAFARLRRMEQVQSAFVPTCDEFYLSHALDDYRTLARQAYFFAVGGARVASLPSGYSMRVAGADDAEMVRQESGDFFADLEGHIARQELFVTLRADAPVGFGLLIQGALYNDVASIGMYTIERFRQTGVGTATIALLIDECRRRELRAVAGCWYYNHRSKQTLERAGMYSPTRLLKVEF